MKTWVLLILLLGLNQSSKTLTENVRLAVNLQKNVAAQETKNVSSRDVERFLHYIKQLESSGGKNLDHPVIESGIHAGDAAQGQYAMMPNTMEELESRYPSAFTEKSTPDDYAKVLAKRVLKRANNDETVAAGLWNQGHNTALDKFDEIKDTEYAQKYEKLRKQIPYTLDENPYYVKEPENNFLNLKQLLKK